jgi:hypothetical protein
MTVKVVRVIAPMLPSLPFPLVALQKRLSEQLQLIRHLSPRSSADVGPFFSLSKKQRRELEVLDAVALYFNRKGDKDSVAVAIDKDSVAVRFVLAKQITPSAENINHAKKFFSTISSLQNPLEFLPFALENSSIAVRKNISNISDVKMDIVEKYVEEHQFLKGLHEFTDSIAVGFANQLATQWSLSSLEPKALLRCAYIEAKAMAADIITSDFDIINTTFIALLQIVYLVVRSHFGSLLIGYDVVTTPKSLEMAKIRRRFRKLSHYYTGAEQIHHYHKLVPEGAEIPHLWVQGPEPTPLTLSPSPIDTASRHFPTLTEDLLERAQPTLGEQWNVTALPVVHPELLILLHFETIPLINPHHGTVQLIGCTRKCCRCCVQ